MPRVVEVQALTPVVKYFNRRGVFVFVFTLIALKTGVQLSLRDPDADIPGPVPGEEQKMNVEYISAEDFRSNTAEEIAAKLKKNGTDSLLVEFKSEYGYDYFDTGSFVGASADKKIDFG